MSFLGDIFGGGGSNVGANTAQTAQNTSQTGSAEATGQQIANQQTTGRTTNAANQSQQGQQKQNVTSLDTQTQQLLKTLLSTTGQSIAPLTDAVTSAVSGASPIFTNLQNLGNPSSVNNLINSAVGAAKLGFEGGEGNQIEQANQFTGSNDNSASQLLIQKGQRDEATTLGNVAAQTGLQAEPGASSATSGLLNSIVQAMTAGGGLSSNLASVLKGATTTGNTTSLQNLIGQSTTSSLSDLLSSIISSSQQQSSGTNNSTGFSTPSSLSTLNSILDLNSPKQLL